jgi:diaminohydroxyphosphoribosylaminopyrimidine deaminase/5-amino-6-(5-phosphoribosylamino)uracil reductase
MDERALMKRALALAARGAGKTSPNPMVGAVICRDDEILGEGFHRQLGEPHAEVVALEKAGERASGGTLVVSLEPCNHRGRTPPCTNRIISDGVRRVLIAMTDPNPQVNGQGISRLREAGIEVDVGLLEEEATYLNRVYVKAHTAMLPWVEAKMASSLDGRLATATGRSKYLTSEASRKLVHRMRAEADVVLIGRRTVDADDPLLDCRLAGGAEAPGVVVVDGRGRVSPGARLFRVNRRRPAVVAVGEHATQEAVAGLRRSGATVWDLSEAEPGHPFVRRVLERCYAEGLWHVLSEGGAEVFTSLVKEGLVDELKLFVAPVLIGSDGVSRRKS